MICMCLMDYVDPATAARVRPAHRAYIHRLIAEGRLVCAGSFPPDHDGGLFLYDVASLEEARRLVDEDPYLREGAVVDYKLRRYEVHGGDFARLRVEGA